LSNFSAKTVSLSDGRTILIVTTSEWVQSIGVKTSQGLHMMVRNDGQGREFVLAVVPQWANEPRVTLQVNFADGRQATEAISLAHQ
jgi:hypothetical protein